MQEEGEKVRTCMCMRERERGRERGRERKREGERRAMGTAKERIGRLGLQHSCGSPFQKSACMTDCSDPARRRQLFQHIL